MNGMLKCVRRKEHTRKIKNKRKVKDMGRLKVKSGLTRVKQVKIMVLFAAIILFILLGVVIYLNNHYSSLYTIDEYKEMYEGIIIEEEEQYYRVYVEEDYQNIEVLKKEENLGLIFYQGGKVDELAYVPLLYEFAKGGMTTYLVKMPFRLSVLGINRGDHVISENQSIDRWYIAGHSLGGAMASSYVSNSNRMEGLFLFGAYPATNISEWDGVLISVYGGEDRIMNRDKFNESKELQPERSYYYEIIGGNHSGFAEYGQQKGDGSLMIEGDDQRKSSVTYIVDVLNELDEIN